MPKHHNSRYYRRVAEHNNLEIVEGKEHTLVYGTLEDGTRVRTALPRHNGDLAPGTECSIRKWFIRLGILVVLGIGAMSCYITGLGLAQGLRP